jgi:hypothetical protein
MTNLQGPRPVERTLFDLPPDVSLRAPSRRGQPTQEEAARFIERVAGPMREKVFNFIKAAGRDGATIEQISEGLNMKQATVCGRVAELRDDLRLIAEAPEIQRKTRAGVSAKVWVAR